MAKMRNVRKIDNRFESLLTDEDFKEWFFDGSNEKKLMEFLYENVDNGKSYSKNGGTFFYAVVLNADCYHEQDEYEETAIEFNKRFKLLYVGSTPPATEAGTQNGMEKVMAKIRKSRRECAVIFFLKKNEDDFRANDAIEGLIRHKIGISADSSYIDELGLPGKTKWVLTTQGYLNKLKGYINKLAKEASDRNNAIGANIFNNASMNGRLSKFALKPQYEEEFENIIDIII